MEPNALYGLTCVKWIARLYNKANPNIKRPHYSGSGTASTFKQAFYSGWTPGISYRVPRGEVMVAMAPGEVIQIGEITRPGSAGGPYVSVGHPTGILYPKWPICRTDYCHVDVVLVSPYQKKVNRGDEIGIITSHADHAKVVFFEGANKVDPDNYGPMHSYLEYESGPTELDKINMQDKSLIDEKVSKQIKILSDFDQHRLNWREHYLFDLWHKKTGFQACAYSTVEKFKYLDCLFGFKPDLFPNLNKEEVNSYRENFYASQPIVFSLPWVEGGMKK